MTHRIAKIRRQFDRSATGLYDRNAGVQRFMAEQLDRLIRDELLGAPPAPHSRIPAGNLPVLEIGCGTGLLTERLADLLPSAGSLTAADLSPAMLEAAKSRLYARSGRKGQGPPGAGPDAAEPPVPASCLTGPPPDTVRFLQADAEEWAARATSSSYGLIASNACFQWFARPAQTLVHLRRLLKPQGRLMAATFGPATFTELHRSFDKAYGSLEVQPQRHGLTFHGAEEWTAMLRQAGFGEIRTTRLVRTEYFSSVQLFLTNIKSLGASTTNATRLPGLSTRRLFSSMFQHYENDYGSEGRIPVTYEVLLIHAS